jgi:hypothetical protein
MSSFLITPANLRASLMPGLQSQPAHEMDNPKYKAFRDECGAALALFEKAKVRRAANWLSRSLALSLSLSSFFKMHVFFTFLYCHAC